MKVSISKIIAGTIVFAFCQEGFAVPDTGVDPHNKWQLKMIFQPAASTLARESRGFVNIYDGLTDRQVDKAMNSQFERIENMMFTRVKLTDVSGKVLKDPQTGMARVNDDGCD